MKKLFLIVALVLSSCSGIEGNDFDLFNEYYSDCVEYCTADTAFANACGFAILESKTCTRFVWDQGCENYWCESRLITFEQANYEYEIAAGNRDIVCEEYDNRPDVKTPPLARKCH